MKTKFYRGYKLLFAAGIVFAGMSLTGCLGVKGATPAGEIAVPNPINLTLPAKIEVHPFTYTRTFDNAGGIRGIEMGITLLDIDGDTTKAYGEFRVSMYTYNPKSKNKMGKKIVTWDISLLDAKTNRQHWQPLSRMYKFNLQWDNPIPVGQKYILEATFSSPFTERYSTQSTFISGE